MKKTSKIISSIIGAGVIVVLGAFYVYRGVHYQDHYLPNTKVENVNIGKLTYSQAKTKLYNNLIGTKYTLYENKTKLAQISGKKLGLTQNSGSYLKKLMNQQNSWAFGGAGSTVNATSTATMTSISSESLDNFVTETLASLNKGRTATTNASLVASKDSGFTIKAEVQGNLLNKTKLTKLIKSSVSTGQTKVQLTSAYDKPTVTSNDSKLAKELKELNKIAKISGTYTIAGNTEKITSAMITSWLSYTDGKVTLDQAAMKAYLTTLSTKYGTLHKTRQFSSTKRGTVSVPAGIYGWVIAVDSELAKLSEVILAGKDFTRTPIISGKGYSDSGTDIGNTYVEVDKVNQHMWVYIDGKVVLDTDVVTGKPSTPTPSGVNFVWSKQRNATLNGKNDDGSRYATPVSYWMPVDYTGVGIHDSSWQSAYGGTRYLTHGSHGCINTPPSVVAKVYAQVALGTPVIIF